MNQKHLLRFIKKKIRACPDDIVSMRDSTQLTLSQVSEGITSVDSKIIVLSLQLFESLNLRAYDLNVDNLDVHAVSVCACIWVGGCSYILSFSLTG